jgi:transposase
LHQSRYIQAATQGRPEAVQVADRWHLMENASAAFLSMVKQSMRSIRKTFGTGRVDPALLTSAELRQYDGWVRREEENAVILTLAKAGISIKEIARRISRSRLIVRQIVRGGRTDIFRSRTNSLGPFLEQLDAEWANGCRNGAELWRRLKAAGFLGSSRVIAEWATRRRRDEDAPSAAVRPRTTPSARSIARLMTTERSRPSKEGARTMAIVAEAVPALVVAGDLTDRFHQLIQRRKGADLEPWIADAAHSMMAPFASGIVRDQAAVQAALELQWSNGQTEGQNTKLKLVKRQMYGRAKLDLLRARLLGAA